MTPKCNMIVGANGHVICAKSLIGCIRTCVYRKDAEAFKILLKARPPIYIRREVGEGMEWDYK